MILKRLVLQNFRQFYGTQELVFDNSPSKNVCVIYAANGAGKTTLLNAFTWVLYGTLSNDFENPDILVNWRAYNECKVDSSVKVSVQLQFDHDGIRYTIHKDHEVRKTVDGMQVIKEGQLSPLFFIDDKTGEQGYRKNPKVAIDQILPKRLHTFFFFNGERIDYLARAEAYAEIEGAIKTLLGLEILDRGQRHLDGAISILRQKLRKIGNIESQNLIEELEQLKETRTNLYNQKIDISKKIEEWERERGVINKKLKDLEASWKIQTERELLEKNRRESLDSNIRVYNLINEKLNERGYFSFLEQLTDSINKLIEENRKKGEIPSLYKRQFVTDRLSEGRCICGNVLVKGETPYINVEQWLERGGITDVEEVFMGLGGFTLSFAENSRSLFHDLVGYNQHLELNRQTQSDINERLDELSEQIREITMVNIEEHEDPAKLEDRRKYLEEKIRGGDGDLHRVCYALERIEESIKSKERELEGIEEASEKATLAHRRVTVATEVRDILIDMHKIRTQDVRLELDTSVKDIFSRIAFKDYIPTLSEEFYLDLCDNQGNSIAKSTGENQILSLSFVGALANIARKQARNNRRKTKEFFFGFKGGIYPVVIDAAFGQLDKNYREYVARILPELTDQVIILVSEFQGSGEVQTELRSRIQKEYVIHFETTKKDAREEVLEIGGEIYPYISPSKTDNENATIKEIKG